MKENCNAQERWERACMKGRNIYTLYKYSRQERKRAWNVYTYYTGKEKESVTNIAEFENSLLMSHHTVHILLVDNSIKNTPNKSSYNWINSSSVVVVVVLVVNNGK